MCVVILLLVPDIRRSYHHIYLDCAMVAYHIHNNWFNQSRLKSKHKKTFLCKVRNQVTCVFFFLFRWIVPDTFHNKGVKIFRSFITFSKTWQSKSGAKTFLWHYIYCKIRKMSGKQICRSPVNYDQMPLLRLLSKLRRKQTSFVSIRRFYSNILWKMYKQPTRAQVVWEAL